MDEIITTDLTCQLISMTTNQTSSAAEQAVMKALEKEMYLKLGFISRTSQVVLVVYSTMWVNF